MMMMMIIIVLIIITIIIIIIIIVIIITVMQGEHLQDAVVPAEGLGDVLLLKNIKESGNNK